MINELADRLEGEIEYYDEANELTAEARAVQIANTASQHKETILKSLQFAADMEKLFNTPGMNVFLNDYQGSVYLSHGDGIPAVVEKDIYTAARKAVEALEKGEGDGN